MARKSNAAARARANRETGVTPRARKNATDKKVVDAETTSAVDSATSSETTEATPKASEEKKPMAVLTLLKTKKNGSATYGIAGVLGTVRVAKAMFPGGVAPETIEVGEGALKSADPERAAKMAAKAERRAKLATTREERVKKAQDRATKAAERATKAQERAAKLQAKLDAANAPAVTQ
jgi:hypothetical protein